MLINRKIVMKHMFHRAKDLCVEFEADLISRKIVMSLDWIDTSLIESFITFSALNVVNDELEKVNKLPLLCNLDSFNIELLLAGSARFSVSYMRSEADKRENTIVMHLLND